MENQTTTKIVSKRTFSTKEAHAYLASDTPNGVSSVDDFRSWSINYSPSGIRLSVDGKLYGEALFSEEDAVSVELLVDQDEGSNPNRGDEVQSLRQDSYQNKKPPISSWKDLRVMKKFTDDGRTLIWQNPEDLPAPAGTEILPPPMYLHVDVLPITTEEEAYIPDTSFRSDLVIDHVAHWTPATGPIFTFPNPPSLTNRIEVAPLCSVLLGFPQLTQLTLAAWINPVPPSEHSNPLNSTQPFISYAIPGHSGRQFEMHVRAVNRDLEVIITDDHRIVHNALPPEEYWCQGNGCWKHLAVTWSSQSGIALVYLNGIPIAKLQIAQNKLIRRFGVLTIGHATQYRYNGRLYPHVSMIGELAQIRVFSYVLTQGEVQGLVACDNIYGDVFDSAVHKTVVTVGEVTIRSMDSDENSLCVEKTGANRAYEDYLSDIWIEVDPDTATTR